MLNKLEILLKNEIDPAFSKRAAFILKEIEKEKPKKILDVGCGRGFYTYAASLLKFPQKIYAVDTNKKYLSLAYKNIADKRVKFRNTSIYSLPFADNYFDLIICSEVLEHVKEDNKALSELKRVLKNGGHILLTVPNYDFPFLWDPINWLLMRLFNTHVDKGIWWLAGIWADHERLYKEDEVKLQLCNYFKVIKMEKAVYWCWPFSHFILYGIGKNLVEKFGFNAFNRFSFKKKSLLSGFCAAFFKLPANFDRNMKSCVNILVKLQK